MEMIFSAILGDLVNRSMSFVLEKYRKQPTTEENLQRLHKMLLRIHTVVEEAEERHVTNQGMLQQLKIMREEMFKGYYVLDTFRYRALQEKNKVEEVRYSFSLSRFNQAKRVRFSTSNTRSMVFGTENIRELQQMLLSLENMIADTKEFIIFLMSYPLMHRQPYSAHLFLDKYMFGRQVERERIINFLLHRDPHDCETLEILPIVGPARVGKSTLVAHVCNDERVHNYFSLILFYNENDLKGKTTTLRDNCEIKHQNHASPERLLLIIELFGDVDEGLWRRLLCFERDIVHGSKIIITSQSEKIVSFGTTDALRLKYLPRDAYWYFFKLLLFGSTDPEENPKLASIAMDLAIELRGSFTCAYVLSGILRANFDPRLWRMVLTCTREYTQNNMFLLGEGIDDVTMKNHPLCAWRMAKRSRYFSVYSSYQIGGSAQDEVPKMTVHDVVYGIIKPHGRVNILIWKSQIPPYYNYISTCMF